MENNNKIAIIGGGQTAIYAAKEIREHDQNCLITIYSEENEIPYEKPPLSKQYLKGEKNFKDIIFFSKEFLTEKKIDIKTNSKIKFIDLVKKEVGTEDNIKYSYDKLLLANGAINREIDIEELKNDKDIIYLRNIKECELLKSKINISKNILIIGGGFIGLEVASSIKAKHNNVNIIEIGKSLMGRIIPKKISDIVLNIHKKRGNKIYLNTFIKEVVKKDKYYEILLSNEEKLKVDLIIVGIGSIPNTDIYLNTELKINNGLETNSFCETSFKNVYAAGDISNFYHPFFKKNLRLESYTHAQNHGICAGKNIAGVKTIYQDIPWMWSDQFEYNIQLTGICDDFDTIYERGTDQDEGLIFFFIKNDLIQGACGIGKVGKIGRDIKLASRILTKKIKVNQKEIEDQNFKLNKLLR